MHGTEALLKRRALKSTHGGFPHNPQVEQRDPLMKPRRGPARNASPRRQGARGGSDRIHAALCRATACRESVGPRKRPATIVGSLFQVPESPANVGAARFSTRTWPAPCGMAFTSSSSKETEAPKRAATSCGSLYRQDGSPRTRAPIRDRCRSSQQAPPLRDGDATVALGLEGRSG